MLPFVSIQTPEGAAIVLAGQGEEDKLVGFDPVRIVGWEFAPSDVVALVSLRPAAVFYGVHAEWAPEQRMAANPPKAVKPWELSPRGDWFPVLGPGVITAFPENVLRRHRQVVPSVETILVSMLFAMTTIRRSVGEAESTFDCFADLYRLHGRRMPSADEIARCFRGQADLYGYRLVNAEPYAAVIHEAMLGGLRDRELRRAVALTLGTPEGIGLPKLSFTLALLGQDCVCLDGNLLGIMFPDEGQRKSFENAIRKRGPKHSPRALEVYEQAEDAFLSENPQYIPSDPIGRARAQWYTFEAMQGAPIEHRVWQELIER